ncbi:uncharacterized protein H6S33_011049 [Morchella sextelata]|uniref:uncharacterized protein n=1 Tax=Morchella sextelata TaxID=1174677 RepID=UPI001D0360C2|nr:uncharacterized protein H6S33_011049 [Morchella sextelata]KAH0611784.1 hypothetical protein H6S33_011049 [Morchella sextelata]
MQDSCHKCDIRDYWNRQCWWSPYSQDYPTFGLGGPGESASIFHFPTLWTLIPSALAGAGGSAVSRIGNHPAPSEISWATRESETTKDGPAFTSPCR